MAQCNARERPSRKSTRKGVRMIASITEVAVPGGWTRRQLGIAGNTFDLVLPAEPDAFLDRLATLPVAEQDQDVYWAQLWQAAPPTAARVLKRQWDEGARVLEFGCG